MTGEDHEIWSHYAKGVRKLGEKPEAEEQRPAVKKTGLKKELPTLDPGPIPSAWQEAIERDAPEGEKQPKTPEPEKGATQQEPPKTTRPTPWRREPLDLRVERNLSLGDVVIEAKLDLHGQTEAEAHEHLLSFIEKQQALGRRLVLVITGRGREGESVLKMNLPRWCDVPPLYEKILALRTAAPHHGGEGAYYILLRRTPGAT